MKRSEPFGHSGILISTDKSNNSYIKARIRGEVISRDFNQSVNRSVRGAEWRGREEGFGGRTGLRSGSLIKIDLGTRNSSPTMPPLFDVVNFLHSTGTSQWWITFMAIIDYLALPCFLKMEFWMVVFFFKIQRRTNTRYFKGIFDGMFIIRSRKKSYS